MLGRDIKPDSFIFGRKKKQSVLYVLDFGLSARLETAQENDFIPTSSDFVSKSPLYAPINSHLGITLSRKDDLESLGCVLIYLIKGSLPWERRKIVSDDNDDNIDDENVDENVDNNYIAEVKKSTSIETLCKGCPQELFMYLKYVRELEDNTIPNYTYLKMLLTRIMLFNGSRTYINEQYENYYNK